VAVAAAIGVGLACDAAKRGPGQLAIQLVDAPNTAVDEIWVNVTAVRIHEVSIGWKTVLDTPLPPLDLLKLKDSAAALGLVNLPAGTVTQIRLVVAPTGNYVTVGGQQIPLKVPSGAESGIKIQGPWEISACTETSVTLDFDGNKSIWVHPTGTGDEWILRPVIRTKKATRTPGTCDGGGEAGGGVPPGGPGATCTTGGECLSGVCNDGSCEASGPGGPCQADADCASGQCVTGEGTCGPGTAGGVGSSCSVGSDCLSNACVAGKCDPGLQGLPCAADGDCAEGFVCIEASCVEAPTPVTPL
jgi:hypothetical protein